MDELQKRGGKLLYDPQMIVHRRPRRSLGSFCRMLMTYGRGRAEQFREHPTFGSILNFVPPLFILYLLTLPVEWAITYVPSAGSPHELYDVPLMLYVLALFIQTIILMPRGGILRSLCTLPLTVLTHILYGLGFWRGLFTKLKPPAEPPAVSVTLETLSS